MQIRGREQTWASRSGKQESPGWGILELYLFQQLHSYFRGEDGPGLLPWLVQGMARVLCQLAEELLSRFLQGASRDSFSCLRRGGWQQGAGPDKFRATSKSVQQFPSLVLTSGCLLPVKLGFLP